MRNPFVLLALAFLIASASADYMAQFSRNSTTLQLQTNQLTLPGKYGGYNVTFGFASADTVYVSVSGKGESLPALELEIDRLVSEGFLVPGCTPVGISNVNESSAYCTDKKEWVPCSSVLFCEKITPHQPGASGAMETAQKTGAVITGAGAAATGSAQQQALDNRIQPAGAAEKQFRAEQPAGSPQQQGVTTEQIIQLLGALFIAIIVPYLLLQNKAPEISPQERQLLANETRAGILQELDSADKIPTDLSNKLGKSKATIVEHLETLLSAGFVEKLVTPGKKFVFYRLTRKGRIAILKKAA